MPGLAEFARPPACPVHGTPTLSRKATACPLLSARLASATRPARFAPVHGPA